MLRLLQDAGWPDQSAAAAAGGGELGEGANENEPVWVLRDSYMKKMVRFEFHCYEILGNYIEPTIDLLISTFEQFQYFTASEER